MAELGADVTIEGLEETSNSVTDLGKAVESLEPLAQKMGKILESLESSLSHFTKEVEEHQQKLEGTTEEAKAQAAKNREDAEKKHQEDEERRLKAKMAQMVGGGVNTAQYELQLEKVKQQMELVRDAEAKGLITSRESSLSLGKLSKQYDKLKVEATAYSLAGGGAIGRIAAASANRLTSLPGQGMEVVSSQISGIGTGMMGLMSSLPIAGGLFGLILYGIMNRDKINAETGEVVNLVSAATGGMSESAVRYLGSFQQTAEHFYGIQRSEVQSVVKTFIDAGMTMGTILTKQKDNLGVVGHDIMTLTLAIDKNFELASGTSARTVVSLTNDFGMGIRQAGDLYERLAFAGSRSGVGVQNFVNYVMQGASALRQFGVSVENVAVTLLKIQERYETLGMPKALAGTQAGIAMGQITQGIGGMSQSMQAYFGERMGMGTGMEARMNFREGLARISSGGGTNDFLSDFIKQIYHTALESVGGDKASARFMLEQQGFGFEGAKAIMEVGDKIEKGHKIADLSLSEQKSLRESFMTEGQKQSEIQKNIYDITQGLAQVGEGLLQVTTNLLGWGIMGIKWLVTYFLGTSEEKKAITDQLATFSKGMSEGMDKIIKGGERSIYGAGGLLEPIIAPLKDALKFDPYASSHSVENNLVNQAGEKAVKKAISDANTGSPAGMAANALETDTAIREREYANKTGAWAWYNKNIVVPVNKGVSLGLEDTEQGLHKFWSWLTLSPDSVENARRLAEEKERADLHGIGFQSPPQQSAEGSQPSGKTREIKSFTVNVRPLDPPVPARPITVQ